MHRFYLAGLFAVLLLVVTFSSTAFAWDGAIGLAFVDFGDDFGEIMDDGPGLSLLAKNRISALFGIEFLMDLSFHELSGGPDANCTRLDAGGRLFLITSPSVDLYGVAGFSYHSINFPDYADEIDGFSIYYGAGVEFPVSRHGAIDVSARYHDWKADWDAGPLGSEKFDATTTVIDAVYVFKGI